MSTHGFHRSSRALVTLLVAIGLQLTLSPILRAASPAHEALDQFFASQSQEDLPDLLSDPVAIVLPSGNRLTEVADLPTQVEGWSYRSVLPCLLADLDLASGEAIPIQLRGSPEALASQGGYSGGCLSEAPGGGVARAAVLSFTTDRAGGVGRLDAWPADRSEPRLGDTVVRFHPREASENTTILNLCAPSGSGDCARGDLFLRASESTHTRVYLSVTSWRPHVLGPRRCSRASEPVRPKRTSPARPRKRSARAPRVFSAAPAVARPREPAAPSVAPARRSMRKPLVAPAPPPRRRVAAAPTRTPAHSIFSAPASAVSASSEP